MFGWLVRLLLFLAGIVTSAFVASDASNFTVIQGIVAMLIAAVLVATAAFWPSLLRLLGMRGPSEEG